eukprot:CAMPEP_0179150202 /NCGR_PEP_ID=MMETSP0796-20121207/72828_1 /TAXON_ID=73915 /ORGANISM="Pyrodinium bahamense, Strain pbaha01" /LENGTH=144 /DNA_ID=CAMNT_0020851145 /DNA_START=52 /DNA_END=486 /DNA_ORIENTATION=+
MQPHKQHGRSKHPEKGVAKVLGTCANHKTSSAAKARRAENTKAGRWSQARRATASTTSASPTDATASSSSPFSSSGPPASAPWYLSSAMPSLSLPVPSSLAGGSAVLASLSRRSHVVDAFGLRFGALPSTDSIRPAGVIATAMS